MRRRLVSVMAVMALLGCRATLDREPTRIEEARFINLGGIDQWITIRSDDIRNPVLLIVHGGPGDVQSPLVDIYAPYERDFTLVQWDQRGAGRTYGKYGDETPDVTLDRVVTDAIELASYLDDRFEGDGIIVLGHSWGTAIATSLARERPDLISAYVGTGQIASWAESVRWQFDFIKARARERNDVQLLQELEAIGEPDPMDTNQYFAFTRSLRQHFNASDSAWLAGLRDLIIASGEDLESLGNGMMFSGRAMLPFQVHARLSSDAVDFEVPWYVIQGRDDRSTPTDPVVAYSERVSAPNKKLVIIEDAGHFALVTHQEQFIEALRTLLSVSQ